MLTGRVPVMTGLLAAAAMLVKEAARRRLGLDYLAAGAIILFSLCCAAMADPGPLSVPDGDTASHAQLSPAQTGGAVAAHVMAQGIMPIVTTTDLQLESLLALYDVTGDQRYLRFVQDNVQPRDDAHRLDMLSSIGFSLFERTRDTHYLRGFEQRGRADRDSMLRAYDGAISFYSDAYATVRQKDGDIRLTKEMTPIFIDQLQEYASRMAKTGWLTNDPAFYREAAQQIAIFRAALRDPKTGLWCHGRGWYGSSHDPVTTKWGRAQAWMMRSLVETLTYLPPASPEFRQVSQTLRESADTLLRYQDKNGFWHQVVDHPESYAETSSTGLISYYLARAVHQGFLPRKPYAKASAKAFEALAKDRISSTGLVYGGSKSTPPLPSIDRYLTREAPVQDPHSAAAAIFAASGQLFLNKRR